VTHRGRPVFDVAIRHRALGASTPHQGPRASVRSRLDGTTAIGARVVPPQRKSLEELLRDRTFLARRHAELLLIEPVGENAIFRRAQEHYRTESSDLERRQLALALEKALRDPAAYEQLAKDLDAPPNVLEVSEERWREANSDRIDAILAMEASTFNPERGRRMSERFARCLQAEWRRLDGWTVAKTAGALGVSPATVRRDLAYLESWRTRASSSSTLTSAPVQPSDF